MIFIIVISGGHHHRLGPHLFFGVLCNIVVKGNADTNGNGDVKAALWPKQPVQ